MTQKDKLIRAMQFAQSVRSIASSIKRECESYDERWALPYAQQLNSGAEEFLKLFR